MKIIVNAGQMKNHLHQIKSLLNISNKALISVAFLKKSGIELIYNDLQKALKRGIEISIFCGLDFYLTEPEALYELYKLFNKAKTCKLYLCRLKNSIFHPKLYLFWSSKSAFIIVGSANFTRGGLQDNFELSLVEETDLNSHLLIEIINTCESLRKLTGVTEASLMAISQYRRDYDEYHKKIDEVEMEIKRKINKIYKLDISKIKNYVDEYFKNKDEISDYEEREEDYVKAKAVLDELINQKINSKSKFMQYYENLVGKEGKKRLWHSDGLYRRKNDVASQFELFIRMLRKLKENIDNSPGRVFNIGMHYVKQIKGLGVNTLTEIMNTYRPNNFAVLNKNPLSSLKELGFSGFPGQNSFNSTDYESYNGLIYEIMKACKFKSMGQVDHFMNYIYWNYVK